MALPTPDQLGSLDYTYEGLPFAFVTAKQTSQEFAYDGLPFYAPASGATVEPTVVPGPSVEELSPYNAAQFFAMF